jgi:hypothetical protein
MLDLIQCLHWIQLQMLEGSLLKQTLKLNSFSKSNIISHSDNHWQSTRLHLSLFGGPDRVESWGSLKECARITEVLNPKGLKKGMNKTGHMKGLTHSGREWLSTYWEHQQADDQLAKFYFSKQALYKRGRDLNIKTLWASYSLSVFAILCFYCQCPWLSINFF